jgi:ABC-2 type transport system permease protein
MEEKELIKTTPADLRLSGWLEFIRVSAIAVILVILSSYITLRIDLTEDKRYTLSESTRKILSGLRNDLYIQVWLEGEMPVQFKKMKRSVGETLDEFRIASGRKIGYEFINPSAGNDQAARNRQYETLISKGLNPVNIQARDQEGGASQKIIFPGLTVNYNGAEIPVNFLKNNPSLSPEQNLLNSMEGLEYEIIQTITTITSDSVYRLAFIEGYNEIPEIETADITLSLAKYFTVDRGTIGGRPGILDRYAAVIVAGPENRYDEKDKFVLDQYLMNGGRILWLLDEVAVSEDSLAFGETAALYRPLGLEDQLFRYGVRINPSVVQDLDCLLKPFNVISGGARQQVVPVPWLYYPLLYPAPGHPVTRNLNRVLGKYVNYIDTVGRDPGINKTILLTTSPASRILNPPFLISLRDAENSPDGSLFNRSALPVAVLLEGSFESVFKNRLLTDIAGDKNVKMKERSPQTRMIVISDGDIIRNEVRTSGGSMIPLTLGLDRYTMQTFGNRDFIVNCVNYLVDNDGLMQLRSREMKMRLLDKTAIRKHKVVIQLVNVTVPVLIVIIAGLFYNIIRKRRYTGSSDEQKIPGI